MSWRNSNVSQLWRWWHVLLIVVLVTAATGVLVLTVNVEPAITKFLAAHAVTAVLIAFLLAFLLKKPRGRDLGINLDLTPSLLANAGLFLAVYMSAVFLMERFLPTVGEVSTAVTLKDLGVGDGFLGDSILVSLVGVAAPVGEELYFRMALLAGTFHVLKNWKKPWLSDPVVLGIALFVSSAMFMSAHGGENDTVWQMLTYFVMGSILGIAFYVSGSIFVSVFVHSTANAVYIFQAVHSSESLQFSSIWATVLLVLAPVIALMLTWLLGKLAMQPDTASLA